MIKLLFLVNGPKNSAAGIRAERLTARLPTNWDIQFRYRPTPKWKGILPFIQAALRFQPHLIYVMDSAYTGVLAGCAAKKLLGCQLIIDTGDVAFELAKSTGVYSTQQLALIQWVEQLAIQHSDQLVVRGSFHQQWLAKQGIQKVEFIPDGVDVQAAQPVDPTPLKQQLGLEHCLVVGMVGTMIWSERYHMCYGWDIVEALAFLKDIPVKALLVGDGDGRGILEQRAAQLGVRDRVIFTGRIPYQNLPDYLLAMDVCVSTQSNDLVGMVRTTGKLPLYLAYGRYIIATDVGEASRVLPNVGCLLPYTGVRDDEYPSRLAAHLRLLVEQPELLAISTGAKQVATDNFDYPKLSQRLEKVCCRLIGIESS